MNADSFQRKDAEAHRISTTVARQGVLKKCVLPGRKRAVGILESSLVPILTEPEKK